MGMQRNPDIWRSSVNVKEEASVLLLVCLSVCLLCCSITPGDKEQKSHWEGWTRGTATGDGREKQQKEKKPSQNPGSIRGKACHSSDGLLKHCSQGQADNLNCKAFVSQAMHGPFTSSHRLQLRIHLTSQEIIKVLTGCQSIMWISWPQVSEGRVLAKI